MPELTPQLAETILAACRTNAAETADAFSRALDSKFTLEVGEPEALSALGVPDELSGPGLAVVLIVGNAAALLVLPEATGLVPAWCEDPDPTGTSKLTTLAQELGMLVLPEDCMPDDFKTGRVKNLAGAMRRGGLSADAVSIPIDLTAGDKHGVARLVWPIAQPTMVLGVGTAKAETKAEPKPPAAESPPSTPAAAAPAAPPASPPPKPAVKPPRHKVTRPEQLPEYTRSLLKIKVPVVVTLAEQRQPLHRIIELGPGSIIQFEKSCEEVLDLEVGRHRIASGEAVKVGDKFGLRITSIVLPDERFASVKSTR